MSGSLAVRILLAEDFRAFRRFIRTILQTRPEWQVIFETTDGLETVQKSEELQPDLILLDIGLPKLNGVDAARRIAILVPHCKILFLSQESSLDVVSEALSTGRGYVLKSEAETDLLIAIEAVVNGHRFVSSSLRSELRLEEIRSSLWHAAAV